MNAEERIEKMGRDYLPEGELCHWANPKKPKEPINGGKWVRVKFVEVDDAKA